MEVTSATSKSPTTGGSTSTSATSAASKIDYNMFLQLLIAEMKNQDPTNPTDTSQYMSQFAQFSQVEQAIQTNSKLDSLMSVNALEQADGLIGHTVSYTSTKGTSESGKIAAISFVNGSTVATLADGKYVTLGEGVTIS
jgi:flagellar basal-body rod modification protein FlgD